MNRQTRNQWLAMLAKLTSPTHSGPTAQAFAAYLPMLTTLPDAAFTLESLDHVARQCSRGVPSYGELRQHLTAWWNDNRPILPALPAPYEHVPTPPRTRPTTDGLKSIRDIIAENDAFLHAQHAAIYNRIPEQTSTGQPRQAPQLTREQLNHEYAKAGAKGPQAVS